MAAEYKNYLLDFGVSNAEAMERCREIYDTIFYGKPEERFYNETEDMGYIIDTGNLDVRTEGMSYGMMMSVQMDRKEVFDRLWKWARTYMYLTDGPNKGYFAWSCKPDGSKNSYGAAPDGEEFFAMALIFAGNRWGNGNSIFNYHKEAAELLHTIISKGYDGSEGRAMFDRTNHLIRFIAEVDFTDPSYHLPHFYQLYADYCYPEDRDFFLKAAEESRKYLKKTCDERTGMSAEYAEFDGTPHRADYDISGGRHDWYYSDAYRTIMNIALLGIWFGREKWMKEVSDKLLHVMTDNAYDFMHIFETDGTKLEEKALHPVAMLASNAAAGALTDNPAGAYWIRRFLETPLRLGDRRYYDNCLYFFSYLLLSGNYRIY